MGERAMSDRSGGARRSSCKCKQSNTCNLQAQFVQASYPIARIASLLVSNTAYLCIKTFLAIRYGIGIGAEIRQIMLAYFVQQWSQIIG